MKWHWFVKDFDFVKQGQCLGKREPEILEWNKGIRTEYFYSEKAGVVLLKRLYCSTESPTFYKIFDTQEEAYSSLKYTTHIETYKDPISNVVTESLEIERYYLAGYNRKVNMGYPLNFRVPFYMYLQLVDNEPFIKFEIDHKGYRPKNGDTIALLLRNGNYMNFPINEKPSKADSNKDYVRVNLYKEHITQLLEFGIEKVLLVHSNGDEPHYFYHRLEAYFNNNKAMDSILSNYIKDYLVLLEEKGVSLENKPNSSDKEETEDITVEKKPQKSSVYLMMDVSTGYYKIGLSNKPKYREHTLQCEKPTIELVCSKEYPHRKIAEAIEKALHSAFAEKRIRGEWFNLDENELLIVLGTLK